MNPKILSLNYHLNPLSIIINSSSPQVWINLTGHIRFPGSVVFLSWWLPELSCFRPPSSATLRRNPPPFPFYSFSSFYSISISTISAMPTTQVMRSHPRLLRQWSRPFSRSRYHHHEVVVAVVVVVVPELVKGRWRIWLQWRNALVRMFHILFLIPNLWNLYYRLDRSEHILRLNHWEPVLVVENWLKWVPRRHEWLTPVGFWLINLRRRRREDPG